MRSNISYAIKLLGYGQDYVKTGQLKDIDNVSFYYLLVADGHGGHELIQNINMFDWDNILKYKTAKDILSNINREILLKCNNSYRSGSTLSIVKIYESKIFVYWLGDSQVHIKINDEAYFKTDNHNTENTDELKKHNTTHEINTFKILNDHEIGFKKSKYFKFQNIKNELEYLSVSRCLGHNFITLQHMDSISYNINKDDTFSILVASDGLHDMLYEPYILNKYPDKDAQFFVDLAENRWNQDWNYITDDLKYKKYKFSEIKGEKDDIAVAIFHRKPL